MVGLDGDPAKKAPRATKPTKTRKMRPFTAELWDVSDMMHTLDARGRLFTVLGKINGVCLASMPRRNSRARSRQPSASSQTDQRDGKKDKEKKGSGTPRRGTAQRKKSEKKAAQREERSQTFSIRPPQAPRLGAGGEAGASGDGGLVEGRVEIHPDGFGFLIAKDPKVPNIYIPAESLRDVMHRDEVRVRVTQAFEGGGKLRGNVIDITKRTQKEIVALYRPHGGGALAIPAEARDRRHAFKLDPSSPKLIGLKPGATLICRITGYPTKIPGAADVVDVVADPKSPSFDTMRVLLETAWPREFSRAALSEAENRALRWRDEASPHRKDLRSLPLVTIDGRDAKDFDDAVCARIDGNGTIRLWVAIADVSTFVKVGTALDREAYERATSVYFPDHVVPMLPEVLSNGVCSLNPFEERPCMVCECSIDAHGKVKNYDIYEGLMISKRRLTYEQAQAYMDKEPWAVADLKDLAPSLDAVIEVYKRLRKAKTARGAIDLDIPEAQVLLNKDGSVRDIQPRTRIEAHRLIEECMLIANDCTARYLETRCAAGVYRIHEKPDPKRVQDLVDFLALSGVNLIEVLGKRKRGKPGDEESPLSDPADFQKLLDHLRKQEANEDSPLLRALQPLMLRTLKQAKYSTARIGHFALATLDYTHFTSPIRRYPDLMVHRLIKEGLKINQANDLMTDLEAKAQHCSDQERSAMEMERKLIETKKCRYLEQHLGEEFVAWITGSIEKGLFCQIDGHFVDGLVPAELLEGHWGYGWDSKLMAWIGPGKHRLAIGSRVRIRVARVDIENRKIDFELMEVPGA
jgi:ribonuclease R